METPKKKNAEKFVKDIRKNTRRIFSAEQKILIVMEGLRAETSVAELCRKQHRAVSDFYSWNKKSLWKLGKSVWMAMCYVKQPVMK